MRSFHFSMLLLAGGLSARRQRAGRVIPHGKKLFHDVASLGGQAKKGDARVCKHPPRLITIEDL
jgi:hypothetical protein